MKAGMKICVVIIFLIGTASLSAQIGLDRYRADRLYESGDHYHAMQLYKQLLDNNANDPEINYNVGNALYRLQMYDQAKQYYQRALEYTENGQLKNDIQYNIANCEFKLKKLEESVERYKQVLRKNPEDDDARKNLEWALKQMQKQNPPPQKNKDQKQSEKNKDSQKQKDKNNQNKNKDQNKRPNEPKDNEDDKNDQKNRMARNQGLTKQEAERILDALKNQEKDYQKKKLKDKVTKEEKTDKDW
jgi:Ca-activated chloride channel family protein